MHSLIDKNTPFYICMSKETMHYKSEVPPIQCKLIKKVNFKD